MKCEHCGKESGRMVTFKDGMSKLYVIPQDDILFVMAASKYICVQTPEEQIIFGGTLKVIEKDYDFLMRIGHGMLVNREKIQKVFSKTPYYFVKLHGRAEPMRASRRHSKVLRQYIKKAPTEVRA
jgi:DNA-binding LytR/AlgR family response regulator